MRCRFESHTRDRVEWWGNWKSGRVAGTKFILQGRRKIGDGEIDYLFVDLGEDNEEDVPEDLDAMINRAESNGPRDKERPRTIVYMHKKSFRVKQENSSPAKVKPMEITVRPNAFPVR